MRVEPIVRRPIGMLRDNAALPIEFDDASGMVALRSTHHRHEKAAAWDRVELVGDGRQRRIGRREELRRRRVGHVEEENLTLPFQHAEQPAQRQRSSVAGQSDVMRLVAAGARAGERPRRLDISIGGRGRIEVHDGEKIRGDACLIARPDVQEPLRRVAACPGNAPRANRGKAKQRDNQPAPPAFFRVLHVILHGVNDRARAWRKS